ncbi:MAG TPA: hypothetical protein PKN87_01305 [Syntrophomonadaceae bacterium]|nr:hypothetical protein [Syntrophomonadaceae bacterium]HPR93349.1 hypothetical protein [Syntrophomonadaceae bacterium]
MEKPVYYTSKAHRANYKRLIARNKDHMAPELTAACYILAGIGTLEDANRAETFGANAEVRYGAGSHGINLPDGTAPISLIEKYVGDGKIDFASILEVAGMNLSYRALIKLAANLYDNDNYANVKNTFSPLNDEYQAIAYQALLILFPSFSKSFAGRYYP